MVLNAFGLARSSASESSYNHLELSLVFGGFFDWVRSQYSVKYRYA